MLSIFLLSIKALDAALDQPKAVDWDTETQTETGDHLYNIAYTTLEEITAVHRRKPKAFSSGDVALDYFVQFLSKFLFSDSIDEVQHSNHDVPNWQYYTSIPVISNSDSNLEKKAKALKMLHHAAEKEKHQDSLALLGEIYLLSRYQIAKNATLSFELYKQLADMGNSTGLRVVGLMYATGLGVERNYPKALIYLNFAAVDGDAQAMHTLGYWHHAGIGVEKSCETALSYYEKVGEHVYNEWAAGPPGGETVPRKRVDIAKKNGGIYGKGASGSGNPSANKEITDINLDNLLMLNHIRVEAGDPLSQFVMGKYYYEGTETMQPNYAKAMKLFKDAYKQYPDESILRQYTELPEDIKHAKLAASQSTGYLGLMHLRGEGTEANAEAALKYFEIGIDRDDLISNYGLGLMHLNGEAGLEKDLRKAKRYFEEAKKSKYLPDAKVKLAEILLASGENMNLDVVKLLSAAADYEHPGALYHLGNLYMNGAKNIKPNCKLAVAVMTTYDMEKIPWHDLALQRGYDAYLKGDLDTAFVNYVLSAEKGFHLSQINAAWLLDSGKLSIETLRTIFPPNNLDIYEVALPLWVRAANQGSGDARVKVGDYFYYGLGTKLPLSKYSKEKLIEPKNDTRDGFEHFLRSKFLPAGSQLNVPNYKIAVDHYRSAAEVHKMSIAMYNLGYMYENGIGLTKDFPLAKRNFDSAKSTNPGSYLPVEIALLRLKIKWIISFIFGYETLEKKTPTLLEIDGEVASVFHEMILITVLCIVGGGLIYVRNRLLQDQ